jgi:hypothetical protein
VTPCRLARVSAVDLKTSQLIAGIDLPAEAYKVTRFGCRLDGIGNVGAGGHEAVNPQCTIFARAEAKPDLTREIPAVVSIEWEALHVL